MTTLTYDFTTEEGSYLASRCCCRILSVKVLQQRKHTHTHVQQNRAAEIQLVMNNNNIVHMYDSDVAKRRKSLDPAWRCLRLISRLLLNKKSRRAILETAPVEEGEEAGRRALGAEHLAAQLTLLLHVALDRLALDRLKVVQGQGRLRWRRRLIRELWNVGSCRRGGLWYG